MHYNLSKTRAVLLLTASAMAWLPFCASAQNTEVLPLWEVGAFAGGVSQQAYPGASQNINRALVLPFFIYRGKFLRADEGTVGLRAINTDSLEVDVGFGGAFGSNSNDIEARKGMPDLGTLVEFGPRLKWKFGGTPDKGRWRSEVALRGVFDLSDGFKDKGLALEPELIFERATPGGWRYSTSLGLVFGDERLSDTFYGVAPAHVRADRPAYSAKAGLIASRLSVTLARKLSPDLRIFGFARVASVEGGANLSSPLVRQNTGATVGMGLTYVLARSSTKSAD
jgi:outer membrane protein